VKGLPRVKSNFVLQTVKMDIAKSIFGPKVPEGYAGREDYNVRFFCIQS
jgi:hypothetical protein